MSISREHILYLARLSALEVDEDDIDALSGELTELCKHIDALSHIDTSHIDEEMIAARPFVEHTRSSATTPGRLHTLDREIILTQLAPRTMPPYIAVSQGS